MKKQKVLLCQDRPSETSRPGKVRKTIFVKLKFTWPGWIWLDEIVTLHLDFLPNIKADSGPNMKWFGYDDLVAIS